MNEKQLSDILLQLKKETSEIQTEEQLRNQMDKYDMLFVGENFSTIYSNELTHSLKTKFHFDVTYEEITKMIPKVCLTLKMKCEPMYTVKDIHNKTVDVNHPTMYQITF